VDKSTWCALRAKPTVFANRVCGGSEGESEGEREKAQEVLGAQSKTESP
jgi:hypothetical protein